jgi:AcrR family transcriptional regulator
MARTRKISDEQILEAAEAAFLKVGFGASTSEIAKAAGISEASIFKRFATKENLFLKALGLPDPTPWLPFLKSAVGQGDLKENLKILGLKIIDFFQENLPKIMMVMAKGIPLPPMIRSRFAPPVYNLKVLTHFFEQEIALGRMQADNPQTAALMFMGCFMNYVFIKQMDNALPEPKAYVESMVETFWKSIQPERNLSHN